jgi:dihydrofolate reductase
MRTTDVLQESIASTGAVLMGRRAYDMGDPEGFEDYEYQVPIFVLTHRPPARPPKGPPITFVTDGVESAVAKAKAAARGKDVTVIGGAATAQECISSGVLDELQIHLVPMLLGEGLRLFEHLGTQAIKLERTRVRESPWAGHPRVTHLRYKVIR